MGNNQGPYFDLSACDCPKASGPNTAELVCDADGECVCPGGYNLSPKGQCVSARKLNAEETRNSSL